VSPIQSSDWDLFFSQRDSALSNDRQTNRPADPQTAATAPHILSHGFSREGAPKEIKDLWPAIHQLFKNVLWLQELLAHGRQLGQNCFWSHDSN